MVALPPLHLWVEDSGKASQECTHQRASCGRHQIQPHGRWAWLRGSYGGDKRRAHACWEASWLRSHKTGLCSRRPAGSLKGGCWHFRQRGGKCTQDHLEWRRLEKTDYERRLHTCAPTSVLPEHHTKPNCTYCTRLTIGRITARLLAGVANITEEDYAYILKSYS